MSDFVSLQMSTTPGRTRGSVKDTMFSLMRVVLLSLAEDVQYVSTDRL